MTWGSPSTSPALCEGDRLFRNSPKRQRNSCYLGLFCRCFGAASCGMCHVFRSGVASNELSQHVWLNRTLDVMPHVLHGDRARAEQGTQLSAGFHTADVPSRRRAAPQVLDAPSVPLSLCSPHGDPAPPEPHTWDHLGAPLCLQRALSHGLGACGRGRRSPAPCACACGRVRTGVGRVPRHVPCP